MDDFLELFGGVVWITFWVVMLIVSIALGDVLAIAISAPLLALNLLATALRWWNKKWRF